MPSKLTDEERARVQRIKACMAASGRPPNEEDKQFLADLLCRETLAGNTSDPLKSVLLLRQVIALGITPEGLQGDDKK